MFFGEKEAFEFQIRLAISNDLPIFNLMNDPNDYIHLTASESLLCKF